MTHRQLPRPPRKIGVLHAKALGDLIVTLPALTAIKQTYPAAELILLAKPWVRDFIENRPSPIDRIIEVPVLPGINDLVETKGAAPDMQTTIGTDVLARFYEAMRAEHFDVIMHLQGDGRSVNPFIKQFAAGLTVGMANPPAAALDYSIPYVHYQSEVLRNLEVAGLIGAATVELEPRFEITEVDRQECAATLSDATDAPYAVLHAGADDIRRLWPADKFAAVGDYLSGKGYGVILTGTPKEEPVIQAIMAAMTQPATACTSLSLGGLAALLARAALVISNDTGPLHLARAVGAKTIGIMWAPNVLNWGPLTRARHRLAISWQLECPHCRIKPLDPWPFQPTTPDCDHPYSFVDSVAADNVTKLADELLG